jgi:GT2 family glycosyltransferase
VLEEYAARDKRIKLAFRSDNGHISKASNTAAELAAGEFLALLDHDDELTEHALYMIVSELNDSPNLDLVYSDEDKITGYGMRFNPYFKPDWNPDLLCSQNYVCHLTVVRTALFRRLGGFREGFEGAQDWDLFLRVGDATAPERISHIPHVLYHWRVIEGSTAQSTAAKPYVMAAQKRAVEEHLRRKGESAATVEILESISQLRVHRPVPRPEPLVSVIIPTRDQVQLLSQCVGGVLEETDYKNIELIIVDNGSVEEETIAYLNELKREPRVTVLTDTRPFNYSRLNNDAAKIAKGSILAFLNNDLEVTDSRWLGEMVSHVVRPEVGGVGARLFFPNGLLQHGGVITGIGGVAGHNHKGRLRHDPGYFNRAILCQNLSAVTAACMLVRKEVFSEVGGFEEEALSVAFNDVDLCLKIRSKGYLIVYTPYAELVHHESASRGYETTPEKFARFESEVETMKKRWGTALLNDPYYNPNLTLLTEDFAFAFPPRAEKPWKTKRAASVSKAA